MHPKTADIRISLTISSKVDLQYASTERKDVLVSFILFRREPSSCSTLITCEKSLAIKIEWFVKWEQLDYNGAMEGSIHRGRGYTPHSTRGYS